MQSTKQHWLRERQLLSISGERRQRLEQSFVSEFTTPAATCPQHKAVLLARPRCKAKAGQNITLTVLPLLSTSFSSRGSALGEMLFGVKVRGSGSRTGTLGLCALTRCFTFAPHEALSAQPCVQTLPSFLLAEPEVSPGCLGHSEEPTLRAPRAAASNPPSWTWAVPYSFETVTAQILFRGTTPFRLLLP